MKRFNSFFFVWLGALAFSCGVQEKPTTILTLITNNKPVDTARVFKEVRGLLSLTSDQGLSIELLDGIEGIHLDILPQLTDSQKFIISTLLETIISHPSTWTPSELSVFYTNNGPDLAELLQLDTTKGYPLEINHASVRWAVEEKNTYMTGPLASTAAVSYLEFELEKPLPSSSYTLGLDNSMGETSEASELVSSILNGIGPSSASFTVRGTDNSISPLWDSLRAKHLIYLEDKTLSLNWDYVEFEYHRYSSYDDRDTMIQSAVEKLRNAPPYVFHALLTPRLSTVLTGFQWATTD